MTRVVVVGGGIAGLGAAYTLERAGVDVTVLESASQVGGRMCSKQWHGAWIDLGAEFVTDVDDAFGELAEELGIAGDRVPYPGGTVSFDVWRDGQAHPLSYTEPMSFVRFGAMGLAAKLRLLRLVPVLARQMRRNGSEAFEPWRAAWCDDESVASWLGRINPELLEYAVEPCFQLYCGWEPTSFGKGMFAYLSTSYRSTQIFTFREGLGQLTRALGARLDVVTGAEVKRVDVAVDPVAIDLEIAGEPQRREADMVIVAVPGSRVLDLVHGLDDARRRFFERVGYVPHELPFFKLSSAPVGVPTGVFYPRREESEMIALGYDRSSTSPDHSFFRVSMRTAPIRRNLETPDREWAEEMLAHVARRYPQVPPLVEDFHLSRWRDALPVFGPGYCRDLDAFVKLAPAPRVAFAGDYLAGPSTGGAYTTGQRAARDVLARLAATP